MANVMPNMAGAIAIVVLIVPILSYLLVGGETTTVADVGPS